uniref:Uncharacterized protein n=1 Tax=Arundo donax TaxID=35708 RepID=A0A0A8YAC1_ARUDO
MLIMMHMEEGVLQETGMIVLLWTLHLIFVDMDGKNTLQLTLCQLL